jgi:hypothetical protein
MASLVRNKALVSILFSFLLFGVTPNANAFLFGPKPGETCKTQSEKKVISGKNYICDVGRNTKLTWILNTTPTLAEKATALAFAGCVQGQLADTRIYWYPRLYLGNIISYGYATDQIDYNKFFDLDIWNTDYITSTFVAASTLDRNWAKLSSLWESGLNNSLKKWQSGGLDGIEAINSSKTYDVQIESICKVALSKVEATSKRYSRSIPQFIIFSAGKMLPSAFGQ